MIRGPILAVDDDEDSRDTLRLAMERLGAPKQMMFARDGEEALAYLQGEGEFSNRIVYPFPLLVLLDLKMPRMDGFQVLHWIRRESTFWWLPVVVLTVSSLDQDVWRAYQEGANSFMVKGVGIEELAMQIGSVIQHWVRFSVHPGTTEGAPPRPPSSPER
jgi:CheY-like chemotaxis protein